MSTSKSGDFVGGLQDAIRQNPVSAALIGVGVLWMFTGGSKITAAAALLGPAARSAAAGAVSGVEHSANAAAAVGDGVRSFGTSVANSVQETISNTATAAGEAASRAYETVRSATTHPASVSPPAAATRTGSFNDLGASLQGNLKSTFERQPLLLGAIGLAIGAGMAAAFPTTQTETEIAGDTAAGMKAQMKDFASATVDKVTAAAERSFEAVKDEAAVQGLTLQAAKDGVAAVGSKVKTAARAARGKSPSNA